MKSAGYVTLLNIFNKNEGSVIMSRRVIIVLILTQVKVLFAQPLEDPCGQSPADCTVFSRSVCSQSCAVGEMEEEYMCGRSLASIVCTRSCCRNPCPCSEKPSPPTNLLTLPDVTCTDSSHKTWKTSCIEAYDGKKGTNLGQEWIADGENSGAWIQFDFPGDVILEHLDLWRRCSQGAQYKKWSLTFSDGSTQQINMPCDGGLDTTDCSTVQMQHIHLETVTTNFINIRGTRPCDSASPDDHGIREMELYGWTRDHLHTLPLYPTPSLKPLSVCTRCRDVWPRGCHGFDESSCVPKPTGHIVGYQYYRTFDDQYLAFNGPCKYNLVSSTTDHPYRPSFSVYSRFDGTPRYMELYVYGHVVRLDENKQASVDGVSVPIPTTIGSNIHIGYFGSALRLVTDFQLTIMFDCICETDISLPPRFQGFVTGILGNMNGELADDVTWSADWQVDDPENPDCATSPASRKYTSTPLCGDHELQAVRSAGLCSVISDAAGVYGGCVSDQASHSQFYADSCEKSTCCLISNRAAAKETACSIISAFASQCAILGYVLNWRIATDCPMVCPDGQEYHESVPGCTPTCSNPDAALHCALPGTKACVCSAGTVLDTTRQMCVPPEHCGCVDNFGPHAIGETWLSADCDMQYSCEPCLTCSMPVGQIITYPYHCPPGQVCGVIFDLPICIA